MEKEREFGGFARPRKKKAALESQTSEKW